MKLTFFEKKGKQKLPGPPVVYLNISGSAILSGEATALLNPPSAEATATFCFDEDSKRWLLAYWPKGNPVRPLLRQVRGDSKRVRFNDKLAISALFQHLGISLHYLTVRLTQDVDYRPDDGEMLLFGVEAELYKSIG